MVRNNVIISEDVFRVYVYRNHIAATLPHHARNCISGTCAARQMDRALILNPTITRASDVKSCFSVCAYRYLDQFVRGYKPMALYYQDLEFKYNHCEGNTLCSLTTFRKGVRTQALWYCL